MNPLKEDTDSDGLKDKEEIMVYKTNLLDSDTEIYSTRILMVMESWMG